MWDGTSAGINRRAYTYMNYIDTNEIQGVSIRTEFSDYVADYFITGLEGLDQIFIEYIGTIPI